MPTFSPDEPTPRRVRLTGPIIGVFGVLLLLFGVLFTVNWIESNALNRQERCVVVLGAERQTLAPDQTKNAAIIAAAGLNRGLEHHEIMIALATSMQESKIRNISYGDTAGPDSRGLFQQRPSMGWGTEDQILDPWYASNRFYQELETIPDYQNLSLTEAAQAVQRSAFPDAYAKHEPVASAFATALTSSEPGPLNCVLRPVESDQEISATALSQELLQFDFGIPSFVDDSQLEYVPETSDQGWLQATWALALAHDAGITEISYNGLLWNREQQGWMTSSDSSDHVLRIVLAAH